MAEKTGKKQDTRFKPGQSGNPDGRPKGTRNFSTEWREFIKKVAKEQGTTPEILKSNLWKVAYKKAAEGDYQFFRDIHDRVYGKPQQHLDHSTLGKELTITGFNYVKPDDTADA